VVFLLQIPLAYLGALGIGALRPLGKRSEWLLLLFSPWLFVTVMPLSIVALRRLIAAGQVDAFSALFSPILLSVPILFILTLFFKGQEPKWRTAQAQDETGAGTFFQKLILPSLPLTAVLAFAAFLVNMQNLLWPLVAVRGAENRTVQVALFILRQEPAVAGPYLAAALTLFGLPVFVFFFVVFGLSQVLYLDRLALRAGTFGTEKESFSEHQADKNLLGDIKGDTAKP
jgi:ABC-type maltose transport system permease subunit